MTMEDAVSKHPLIAAKISALRKKSTQSKEFRSLAKEITTLLGTWATQDLDLVKLQSPLAAYDGVEIKDRIGLFPVLRAGLSMVDGMLDLMPEAHVHHLGLYRESSTLLPVEYYNKLPLNRRVDLGFVLDPMVATAGTAIATVEILKEWGLKRIKFMCILGSKDGLAALKLAHPDIEIYVAAMDEELTQKGYVLPGLGDAGDRLFNTKSE